MSSTKVDNERCIRGEIVFTGMLNGEYVSDTYCLSLGLSPKIRNVVITNKESNAPFATYNVYFDVEYAGCDELYVTVEEEYGGIGAQYVHEPFLAHVVASHIKAPYYALITVYAENEYGSDEYHIDLEPFDYEADPSEDPTLAVKQLNIDGSSVIDIYDLSGNIIMKSVDNSQLSTLANGMYIVVRTDQSGVRQTFKYAKNN